MPTSWRLLRGGTERGRLFSLSTDDHFHLDALNGDMRFWTNGTQRARISRTLTGQTVNGYSGQDLSGYLGLGHFTHSNVPRPVTLLHLDHNGSQVTGWRPWMQTGVLRTRFSDLMYVGMKQEETTDRNDAVVNWADNPTGGFSGPDALRFIFTGIKDSGATVAGSDNGLELARFIPAISGNEGFFAVGNFYTAGLQPDERIDVLDRTIRMRRLLPDYQNDELEPVVVSDANGRLHWRDAATLGSGCSSGWRLIGSDAVTAYNGNTCPPQAIDRVGIGITAPVAKLHVVKDLSNDLTEENAGYFHIQTVQTSNTGMFGLSDGVSILTNIGGRGVARNSRRAFGLWGSAQADENMRRT